MKCCQWCLIIFFLMLPACLYAEDDAISYSLGNGKEYACVHTSEGAFLVYDGPGVQLQSVSFDQGVAAAQDKIKHARRVVRKNRSKNRSSGTIKRAKRVIYNSRRLKKDILLCKQGLIPQTRIHPSKACDVVGHTSEEPIAKIVKGALCTMGNSPVVRVQLFGETICTGVVIGPHTVLTAAHCVGAKPEAYTIHGGFGSYFVTDAVVHAGYGRQRRIEDFDVAILTVHGPIKERAVSIHRDSDLEKGELAMIAGFGLTERGAYGRLRAGFMRVNRADSRSISALYTATMSDTCSGDSGGPLLIERNGSWYLAGLTSNGNVHCSAPDDARFAALSDSKVLEFIDHYRQ